MMQVVMNAAYGQLHTFGREGGLHAFGERACYPPGPYDVEDIERVARFLLPQIFGGHVAFVRMMLARFARAFLG